MQTQTDTVRRGWTSASNAGYDALCPGRHVAQRGIPEPVKDADAQQGTLIHEALASGNPGMLNAAQQDVFDSCKKIEAKVVEAYFQGVTPAAVFRHRRFWAKITVTLPDKSTVTLEHSGEMDVVYRAGTKALVIDYKTLAGDVAESPKNMQLRDGACLVKGSDPIVNEVGTAIIQPFVTHSPEICAYAEADLARATQEMFARVDASNRLDSKRVAGESQCNFCLAKTRCREYAAWMGGLMPNGEGIEPVVKELVFQTAMESWTPQQRAIAAKLLTPAGKALDLIKDFLKDGITKDANFVPGWTLTKGTTRTIINNPQEAFTRFNAAGGQLPQFMDCLTVSMTKLREQLAVVTGLKGKALVNAMDELVKGITDMSTNAPSLKQVKE